MPDDIGRLVIRIEATTTKLEKALARAKSETARQGRAIGDNVRRANKGVSDGLAENARGLARLGNISGAQRFVFQNTAAQLGDIAVQLETGADKARVFGQQLPQIAGGFSALGGAVGTLAPILGTIVAIGIPLGAMLLRNGTASEDLAGKTQSLADAIRELSSATDAAQLPLGELEAKYGAAAGAAKAFIDELRRIEGVEALEVIESDIEAFARGFADLGNGLTLSFERAGNAISEFQERFDELERARQTQEIPFREISAGQRELQADIKAFETYREALDKLTSEFDVTIEEAGQLADALVALSEAEGPAAQAQAAVELKDLFVSIVGVYEDMNDAQRAFFKDLRDLGAGAAELQGELERGASSMFDLVDAIGQATGGLDGLVARAGDLGTRMRVAAENAYEYLGALGRQEIIEGNLARAKTLGLDGSASGPDAAISQLQNEGRLGGELAGVRGVTRVGPEEEARRNRRSSGGGGGGGKSDAEKQSEQDARDAERIFEATRTAAERYAAELARVEELYKSGKLEEDAYKRGLEDLWEEFSDGGRVAAASADAVRGSFDTLFDSIVDGSFNAGDALQGLGQQLASLALQESVFRLLGGAFPNIFGADGFVPIAGARAGGGGARAGLPYLVNEGTANSEIFVPSQSGAVLNVPQAQAALRGSAGGSGTQVIINNSSRAEVDATPTRGPDGREVIIATVRDATARGRMDGGQGGRFGTRPQVAKR